MSDDMRRVRVVGRRAKYIPGYGTRRPGQVFILPAPLAESLALQPEFTLLPTPPEDTQAEETRQ